MKKIEVKILTLFLTMLVLLLTGSINASFAKSINATRQLAIPGIPGLPLTASGNT